MEEKHLLELLDYLASSSFVEFEMERGGFKLRLVRQPVQTAPATPAASQQALPAQPLPAGSLAAAPQAPGTAGEDSVEFITSPMVGTFYRAPNPNAEPFVDVGDVIEAGQVIGIVEAMKLMNEIEADRSGEIVEIAVANGQPVEYGETIFKIRPTP